MTTEIDSILLMQNTLQHYAWGSRTALAEMMGRDAPTARPEAELWMGAHPKAPSKVWYGQRWEPLDQLIGRYPNEMLGPEIAKRFDNQLPYLFKLLAAGKPLSIQAHPDKEQARQGFRRENLKGVPLDSPRRNYKDNQHKPECMCALTTFWGLCGFRPLAQMTALMGPVWPATFNYLLKPIQRPFNSSGLKRFFQDLMDLETSQRGKLVAQIVDRASMQGDMDPAYPWIVRLNQRYPADTGVLAPLLLNVIKMEPGQAVFLPAGQLHAYLEGFGIELMANSDNVLRGGLTPKHIDVSELMKILDFEPRTPKLLPAPDKMETEFCYDVPAREFALSAIQPTAQKPYTFRAGAGRPEIIICIQGQAAVCRAKPCREIKIQQGQSVFVPAAIDGYTIKGQARLYKASVNLTL
jgi:mannose-6-phosphate isomerase